VHHRRVGRRAGRPELSLCAELEGAEAVSCIRGTKVQNLLTAPPEDLVAPVRPCDGFAEETTLACYRWLGKVLAVMTNGEFESFGCPPVPEARPRNACIDGARSYEGPLVTFS